MGSDGNKFNDCTGFQPSEPKLCANGCGFFGTAATMNFCSKCYRDLRVEEEQASSAKAAMDKIVSQNQKAIDEFSTDSCVPSSSSAVEPVVAPSARVEPVNQPANRCWSCNKKVGVTGFQCRCGFTFCGSHRYPEKHECLFDFKAMGRDAIANANPTIKADKIQRF